MVDILKMKIAYDIMPLGKRDSNSSKRTKIEAPGSVSTGGFFIENLGMGKIVYGIIRG